jgi:hypothetical protein
MPINLASMRSMYCAGAMLAAGAAPALAEDDISMQLGAFGGFENQGKGREGLYGLAGSLTLPVERHLGLQFDLAYAAGPNDHFFDLGAHIFWRNPATGLVGIYAGMARSINQDHHQRVEHFGLEGEQYWANSTLGGALGYETGNKITAAYANARLDYYLTPNFMTSGGLSYEAHTLFYSSRAEYQLRTDHETGLSLFMSSDWNSSEAYQMMGGVRLTIGEPMTLRDRHRHQAVGTYVNPDYIGTDRSE